MIDYSSIPEIEDIGGAGVTFLNMFALNGGRRGHTLSISF